MLKLYRKPGERIVIQTPQGDVVVTFLGPGHTAGRVKIGIEAPREISIRRDDLKRLPATRS